MKVKFKILLLVLISLNGNADNSLWDIKDCSSLSVVSKNNVKKEQLYKLYNKIIGTCKEDNQTDFFNLFTEYQRNYFKKIDTKKKEKFYNDACALFLTTDKKLNEKVENGTHLIKDKKKVKNSCGFQISYWYIYTKEKKKIFRLKLLYEGSKLKINEH